MENVISLTHATDIDGVGSAALVRIKYGTPLNRIFFTDYNEDMLRHAARGIKGAVRSGTILIIADLAVNDRTLPHFLNIVKTVKRANGRVFWFDHHPWTSKAEKTLAPLCDIAIFGENHRYCGAEITRIELNIKGKFPTTFCRIVHYSDFNIKPPTEKDYRTVGYYALSITSYHLLQIGERTNALRHMAEVISSGKLLDGRIKRDADRFRKLNDMEVKKMLSHVYLGKEIALGFAGHIQKTYACMKLIEKTGKDIGIYVNLKDRRGHMRSIRSDVSRLAQRFRGGGHVHAAGFSPDFKKYNHFRKESDRARFLGDLEKTAVRERIFENVRDDKNKRSSREPMLN